MPGSFSKEHQVAMRKKLVLELLALSAGGQASYNHLTESLLKRVTSLQKEPCGMTAGTLSYRA